MNIVVVESLGISKESFEQLKHTYTQAGHTFTYYMDRQEDEPTLVKRISDADIVVISNIPLTQRVLTQCPRLKLLSVAFTGLDHIDLAYCQQHNIAVVNAAGYSTTAVSELTLCLMIDLLRKVTEKDRAMRHGEGRNNYVGSELGGKTVGVVGTGAIGTAVVKLLTAFGCTVLAYNRSHHAAVEALGARYVDLDELLRQSDIVTLHVPLTDETRHLIDEPQLRLMKPSALLINTARGNVTNIDAVARALREQRLGGAAFDVYETEPPLAADHPLLHSPNAVCVPHLGFATHEAFAIRADIVFRTVERFVNGYQG